MESAQRGTTLLLRIDWADLDLYNHVNNVAYFRYMQAGRVNYWEKAGIYNPLMPEPYAPIVAQASCTMLVPMQYPGTLRVVTQADFTGTTSFGFIHTITDASSGELVARGEDVMVLFDFGSKSKVALSEEMRRRIEEIEGGVLRGRR